jgi:hypothetical protein
MRFLAALTLFAMGGCSLLFQESTSTVDPDASPNTADAISNSDPDANVIDPCSWLTPLPQFPVTIICDDFEGMPLDEQWRQQRSGDGIIAIADAPDRPDTQALRFSALAEDDAYVSVATNHSQLRFIVDFYVLDVLEVDLIEFALDDGSIIELVVFNGALYVYDSASMAFHNAGFTVPASEWWTADLSLHIGTSSLVRLTTTFNGTTLPGLENAPLGATGKVLEARVGVAGGAGTVLVDNAAIVASEM